jgi:hypothetical protein
MTKGVNQFTLDKLKMKNRVRTLIFLIFSFGVLASFPIHSQDLQRGLKNYQEIMRGTKKLEQLLPEEKQEVIIVYQRLNARKSRDDKSPDCQNAISRAESSSSELADYARRLRNCAESQNYNDDCSTEFRRVKNSYGDYESAVSSVGSYCR